MSAATSDDFRPSDALFGLPAETFLLASVKGESRRQMITAATREDRLEQLHESLLASELSDEDRKQWGRLHPSHLGGEFLPNRSPDELEVARITIRSTTYDVVSLYARRHAAGYDYRLVDEYDGEFLEGDTTASLPRQMTQAEVVEFFLGAYPLADICEGNELTGKEAQDFTLPSSTYYPDFEARVRAHLWEMCPQAEDEGGCDEEDEYEDEDNPGEDDLF